MTRHVGTRAAALGLVVAAAACASGPPEAPAPPAEPEGPGVAVEILAGPDRVHRSRTFPVETAAEGHLAVFLLRPGAGVGLLHPTRERLRVRPDGTVEKADGARPIPAGVHAVVRPGWTGTFVNLGRLGSDRHARRGLAYPYWCAPPTPRRVYGGDFWILAVWSAEPLQLDALWPDRSEACGIRTLRAMAETVARRVVGPDQPWSADLLEVPALR